MEETKNKRGLTLKQKTDLNNFARAIETASENLDFIKFDAPEIQSGLNKIARKLRKLAH